MIEASFFDDTGLSMVPASLNYRIDDELSGAQILGWTSITPAASVSIEVSSALNAMISNSRSQETHVVTVQLTDPSTNGPFLKSCRFVLQRPAGEA